MWSRKTLIEELEARAHLLNINGQGIGVYLKDIPRAIANMDILHKICLQNPNFHRPSPGPHTFS